MLRQADRAETQGANDWARYWKVEAARHLLGDAWSTGEEDIDDFCERVVGILKHDIEARQANEFRVTAMKVHSDTKPGNQEADDAT